MPPGARPDPPPHSMRIIVGGTYGGDTPVANTLWVRNGNAQLPSVADFDTLTGAVGAAFANRFKGLLSQQLVWTTAEGFYYVEGGIALASARGVTGAGTQPGNALPSSVALCIGWQVQQHYKGGHPRTYLCGPDPNQLTGGRRFTPGLVASAVVHANEFHADVNGFSFGAISLVKLGVVSFVLRKQWRTPPVFRDYVPGGAHCDQRVDTQRRRLGRDIPP